MQQADEKDTKHPLAPTESISEPLTPLANDAKAQDEDDSPDAIFVRAVAEIPTQPLPKQTTREETQAVIFLYVLVLSFIIGTLIGILTYPSVTITLVPVHQSVTITTPISIPTRTLAPVTLSQSLTTQTTGKGHQDPTRATGTLTFYNGLSTLQSVAAETVLTGADGIQIAIDQAVSIPSANPPSFGETSVPAHAANPGRNGNIYAEDMNATLATGLFVKNLTAFTGGQDARDFQAVAQHDLDTLSAKLKQQLTKAMPQAFNTPPGETVEPINCTTHLTADHGIGDEAQTVTVSTSETCNALAYSQAELERQATIVFNATRPGKQYELVGDRRTTVLSLSPFTVRVSGFWSYVLTQGDEQAFAEHIQGDTPAEARAYLFTSGKVERVTMTETKTLPDSYHIKFLILIGV